MAAPAGEHERWDKICALFSIARALPQDARARYLSVECRGDSELERELVALLALDAPPSGFLKDLQAGPLGGRTQHPAGRCCEPGVLLNGRFEILRFLGAGGMGDVYEAADTELADRVAIKVLRANGLPEEFLTSRFRREIKIARQITHPNVCRVFDFSRHETTDGASLHYYVMELLEGETLAARLATAKPDVPLAFDLARQIAAGLTAAHQVGIVHRDLKPANVMLTGHGTGLRAVITDFGLAAPLAPRQTIGSLGSTGFVLGTPGYMAPEQLYGGPVTPATDIYAYGILLHELAAGEHPGSPAAQTAEIPRQWRAVIARCMEFDPKLRFANVNEAYQALSGARRHGVAPSRRTILALGAGAAAMSLFAGGYRFLHQNAGLPNGALVVVSPLLNSTGESRFDGFTVALQGSLGQSSHLNVWSFDRLGAVLRSMRLEPEAKPTVFQWREIAFREQAPLLVFSTVSRLGAGYVLSIHLEQIGGSPQQPVRTWDHSFSSDRPSGLFDSINDASAWIRQTAGEDARSLATYNLLPQDITSSSWEALELFGRAQSLSAAGKPNDAIPLLKRAVELDPQFATGFMHLGDLLNTQGKSEEGFQQWRRAVASARTQRLSEHERLNIEGRYALEIGDYSRAEPVLRDWVQKFPNDPAGLQLLGSCLLDLGRYPEGIEWALRAERQPGLTYFGVGVAIRGYGVTNQTGEMETQISILERVSPAIWTLQEKGIAAALHEDYRSAESFFQHIMALGDADALSRGTAFLAVLAADQGDFQRAATLLQDQIVRDREAGQNGFASRKAAALAFVEGIRGNGRMARLWSLEAVSMVPSTRILMLSACTLARCGGLGSAREIARQLPQNGPRNEAASLRVHGEIALAQGDQRTAIASLERAAKLESAIQPKEYLAHALDVAGQPERARLIYQQLANTPYLIWDNPESEWPGIRFLARQYLQTKRGL